MSKEFQAEWLARPVKMKVVTYGELMHMLIGKLKALKGTNEPDVIVKPLLHRMCFVLESPVEGAPRRSTFVIDHEGCGEMAPANVEFHARRALEHFRGRRFALDYLRHGQRPIQVELHPELWEVVCTWQETQNDAPVPCRLHYTAGLDIGKASFHAAAIRVVEANNSQQALQNQPGASNTQADRDTEDDLDKLSELSGVSGDPFETTTIDGFEGDWVIFIVPFNT
ncbi:MAG: hypothetical protein KC766_05030 [Myxococcales bacterium]|nr:hypothetical protein [Myxococcales bacterium]